MSYGSFIAEPITCNLSHDSRPHVTRLPVSCHTTPGLMSYDPAVSCHPNRWSHVTTRMVSCHNMDGLMSYDPNRWSHVTQTNGLMSYDPAVSCHPNRWSHVTTRMGSCHTTRRSHVTTWTVSCHNTDGLMSQHGWSHVTTWTVSCHNMDGLMSYDPAVSCHNQYVHHLFYCFYKKLIPFYFFRLSTLRLPLRPHVRYRFNLSHLLRPLQCLLSQTHSLPF